MSDNKNKKFLKFQVDPVSVNDAYYMRNKSYNAKARKYREKFLTQLQSDSNQRILNEIRKSFDPSKHCLKLIFEVHIPRAKYFTKKGSVSRNSKDLDNQLKLPIDFLCNKKYNGDDYVVGSRNLGIDDQFIIEIVARKLPSLDKKYYIFIGLEIIDLPK